MSGFICMKPITLSGQQFVPGDVIPAGVVLPSRELALKRNGCIVEAPENVQGETPSTEASKLPQNSDFDNYPIEIPISTSEGLLTATVGSKSVATAFSILQLGEKDAKAAIETVTDDDALMLMNAVERRKNVLSALKARHETLTAEGGGADGEDV